MTLSRVPGLRAAVLGAFPFPYPQGSQIFAADHARALARAGVEVRLFTYGRGTGEVPEDLDVESSPRWLSPVAMRSGPTFAKLPADAALLATLLRAHREQAFEVAFAHNAEAALVAIAARAWTRTPVIYVAHTVLKHELSAYAAARWRGPLGRIGDRIDRLIAGRVDGIVALCEDASIDLAPYARCPIEVIPPGLDPQEAPERAAIDRACSAFALNRDHYALYCGNLDGYQDLPLLADAARALSADAPEIVIATHDASRIPTELAGIAKLRCIEVRGFELMRALIAGAQCVLLTRRRSGGFPIKLLNYMEAAKPIVAFERIAPGFTHRENAWLLRQSAGGPEIARAIQALARDAALRNRLGAGARRRLETRHGWARLAQQTRAFAENVAGPRAAVGNRTPTR